MSGSATTEIEVTMQFYRRGLPATDINISTPGFPTVRIWDITDGTNVLALNTTIMNIVKSGTESDGFYKYVFTGSDGFNETKKYNCHFDGGSSIPNSERYNNGVITPSLENEIYRETEVLRKFETNRTFIDVNNAELHVYDDDTTTLLWRFKLLDSKGKPNINEIAERLPITGGSLPYPVAPTPTP